MIILLGFKNFDEADAEYQVTGQEARHLAAIVGHPGAVKVISANVTFFHEVLDDVPEFERVKGEGAEPNEHGQFPLG